MRRLAHYARSQPRILLRWVLALLACGLAGCGEHDTQLLEGRPAGPYRLTLALDPPQPAPGEQTTLTYRLTHADTGQPVHDLQVVHERVIHSFIVARDFSTFAHVHHEDFQALTAADLDYAILHFPYRFPKAGHYRVVSEFTHRDRSWIKQFDLVVGDPPDDEAVKIDLRREQRGGPFTARLTVSPDPPVAGYETELVLDLSRDGVPVTDLELHLGAEVHVALWRVDGELFGHTHSYTPQMAAMMQTMRGHQQDSRHMAAMMLQMMAAPARLAYPGPSIPVRHVFPAPGVYQVFLQTAPSGEPQVFGFMLDVKEYQPGMDTTLHSMVEPSG